MTLKQLSLEAERVTGSALGFIIKSLAHPERRFKVMFETGTGKYVIYRLDNNTDYLVEGDSDRYEFAVPMARIREVKAEIGELTEQMGVIKGRLDELTTELGGFGLTVAG